MNFTNSKKKIMLTAILTSGLALASSQSAIAQPDQPDAQTKKSTPHYEHRMDPDMLKAREKFLGETVAIRKQLVEKNATMSALSNAQAPDATRISQLAGELFDLREQLRFKAKEVGLPMMGMEDVDVMPCQAWGGKHHIM